jgi:hypothetical protein
VSPVEDYLSQYGKFATTDLFAGTGFVLHNMLDTYNEHENDTWPTPKQPEELHRSEAAGVPIAAGEAEDPVNTVTPTGHCGLSPTTKFSQIANIHAGVSILVSTKCPQMCVTWCGSAWDTQRQNGAPGWMPRW